MPSSIGLAEVVSSGEKLLELTGGVCLGASTTGSGSTVLIDATSGFGTAVGVGVATGTAGAAFTIGSAGTITGGVSGTGND